MINAVSTPQDTEQISIQKPGMNKQNVSMRGNKYERTAERDEFESSEKKNSGKKAVGIIGGLTIIATLILGGVCLKKGGKILGEEAKLSEKLKAGWKSLRGKADKVAVEEGKKAAEEGKKVAEEATTAVNEAVVAETEQAENKLSDAYGRLMRNAESRQELEKLRSEIEAHGSDADKKLFKNMEEKFNHLDRARANRKPAEAINAEILDKRFNINNGNSESLVRLNGGSFELDRAVQAGFTFNGMEVTELEKSLQQKSDALLKKLDNKKLTAKDLEAMRDEVMDSNDNKVIKKYIQKWLNKKNAKDFAQMEDVISYGTEKQQTTFAKQKYNVFKNDFERAMQESEDIRGLVE